MTEAVLFCRALQANPLVASWFRTIGIYSSGIDGEGVLFRRTGANLSDRLPER